MNGLTPFHSSVGGALLGAASSAKLALTGRVLGISGIFRGFLRGNTEPWRLSFLTGLGTSGLIASYLHPAAFASVGYSYTRAALSGLLVGFGSSLGNGCTSGHGICGNSRFSIRSFVYTCVFMAAGVITATATRTAEALNVVAGAGLIMPSADFMQRASILALLLLSALMFPALLAKKKKDTALEKENGFLDCLTEFICGSVFGFGLSLSGMTLPSKVAAFLSPLSSVFDPSLLLVMGSALLIATPASYLILTSKTTKMKTPICADRFQVPTNKQVDAKLLIGGLLFGTGWGLGGICPGPALVTMLHPSLKLCVYFVFLCLGFAIDSFGQKIFTLKSLKAN